MLNIPSNINKSYVELLVSKGATQSNLVHYKKWLRFYLDFCFKYHFNPESPDSLPPFLQKLADKRQSQTLRQQAQRAVSLYYSLIKSVDSQPQFTHSPVKAELPAAQQSISKARTAPYKASSTKPLIVAEPNDKDYQLHANVSWSRVYESLTAEIKLRHYSPKTLKTYRSYIHKFQTFLKSKDPASLSEEDVKTFLSDLAVNKNVSASTQNIAFNSLLFLYKNVLNIEFGKIKGIARAKKSNHIPVVLSRREVDQVIEHLSLPYSLAIMLMYGCGLRLSECLNLRIKDFNFDANILTIHNGKGMKDRTLPLPLSIKDELIQQVDIVVDLHEGDINAQYAGTFLPDSLEIKYPNAAKELIWQWFFPAKSLTTVSDTKEVRRYHLHDTHLQRAIKEAVNRAKLLKRATSHSFRHSYASHLLQANYDIHTIQTLMGHSDIRTTLVYLKTVPSLTIKEAKSPCVTSKPFTVHNNLNASLFKNYRNS